MISASVALNVLNIEEFDFFVRFLFASRKPFHILVLGLFVTWIGFVDISYCTKLLSTFT